MNAEILFKIAGARDKVGKPSAEEEVGYMNNIWPQLRSRHLEPLVEAIDLVAQGKRPPLVEVLADRREKYKVVSHTNPSRPRLCTVVISDLAGGYGMMALSDLTKKDLPNYRFHYDIFFGMASPISRIAVAEAEIGGEFDKGMEPIIERLEDMKDLLHSTSDSVAAYLNYKKHAQADSALMQTESTGLSLISAQVELLKAGAIGPAQSQAYAVAGAELSSDLYMGLYMVTNLLYPPH